MEVFWVILRPIGIWLIISGFRHSELKKGLLGALCIAVSILAKPDFNPADPGDPFGQSAESALRTDDDEGVHALPEASPLLEWEQERFEQIEIASTTLASLQSANNLEGEALKTLHRELSGERETLDRADVRSVEVYTRKAAAYTARVQALQTSLASAKQIETKIAHLRAAQPPLTAATAAATQTAQTAQSPGASGRSAGTQVTIYSTSWCGACKVAKRWFDSHGIAYKNLDVEKDPVARMVFAKMGINSVPLIMIGSRRIVGFDEGEVRDALGL